MNNASDTLCLACGELISKATERRNIFTSSSQHVTASWKTFFKRELENRKQYGVLETTFPESGEIVAANIGNQKYVCRKCFYAFEKFLKFEEVQLNNKSWYQYIAIAVATRVATAIAIYWYQLANLCNCYCEAKR